MDQIPDILITALLLIAVISAVSSITYILYLNGHKSDIQADVTLILALTGASSKFDVLLRRLNAQTLKPTQLLIGIESVNDPAYQIVTKFASIAMFPIKVALAGTSETTAQKCHNQLAAAAILEKDLNHYIVMLDADIDPPNWWLAALIKPLVNCAADVVSGYRWQQAKSYDLGANLIAFLDRSIAILPRFQSTSLLWGGSISMRREVFDSILGAKILESTISDDLSISSHVKNKNFRVLTRRLLLVPSVPPAGIFSAYRFGVRQYQIIKIHRLGIWLLALMVSLLSILGWSALIAKIIMSFMDGNIISEVYVYVLVCIYLCVLIKIIFLYKIANKIGFCDDSDYRPFQFLLIVIKPFIDLFHCLMIVQSSITRIVRWGHVTYRVRGISSIRVLKRNNF